MGFPVLLLLLSFFPIKLLYMWALKSLLRMRGARGEGEERREAPSFSLFPSFPARFLFVDYYYFYWDIQREPLRRRQGA